jgi:serine/threonine-protein kinase ULK4
VYKARQKKTIKYAAVKCVDKAYKAKVTNEVRILNMMDHPNILKFHNWYETNNHYWIIVEYCSGGDLMNLLMQDQSLPEETVHLFSLDLVRGLQYENNYSFLTIRFCHSKGIIYCDLKPSNVLIDGCGVLKLSDFGLAQPTKDAESEASPSGRPKRGVCNFLLRFTL